MVELICWDGQHYSTVLFANKKIRAECGFRLGTCSEKVKYRSSKITIFVAGQTWLSWRESAPLSTLLLLEQAFCLKLKFSISAASIDVSVVAPVTGDIRCSTHC